MTAEKISLNKIRITCPWLRAEDTEAVINLTLLLRMEDKDISVSVVH